MPFECRYKKYNAFPSTENLARVSLPTHPPIHRFVLDVPKPPETVKTGERQAVTLNTKKRCSIKSLPNHLVIHLKRFDFDFDTMQQTKVIVEMAGS